MTIMTVFRIYAVCRLQAYLKNTVIIVTDWHEALKTFAFSGDGLSRGDALIVIKMINKKISTVFAILLILDALGV